MTAVIKLPIKLPSLAESLTESELSFIVASKPQQNGWPPAFGEEAARTRPPLEKSAKTDILYYEEEEEWEEVSVDEAETDDQNFEEV